MSQEFFGQVESAYTQSAAEDVEVVPLHVQCVAPPHVGILLIINKSLPFHHQAMPIVKASHNSCNHLLIIIGSSYRKAIHKFHILLSLSYLSPERDIDFSIMRECKKA